MTTANAPTLPGIGDPIPWFSAASSGSTRYHLDTAAGRYIVLSFFGSAGDAHAQAFLKCLLQNRSAFDDSSAAFFGVSIDPEDKHQARVQELIPGFRFFWDFDLEVSKLFGLIRGNNYTRLSLILDERLRIYSVLPFTDDPQQHAASLLALLAGAPKVGTANGLQIPAPVLVVPRVFEPELCARLIEYYEEGGATDSGFMREVDGKTVGMYDYKHKRRSDKTIEDVALKNLCMARIKKRLVPEIHKAFQFSATRIERHIVACYDSAQKAHFRAHRDNTTKGTAHRRFAVTLVLNAGAFEGGQLRFRSTGSKRTVHRRAGRWCFPVPSFTKPRKSPRASGIAICRFSTMMRQRRSGRKTGVHFYDESLWSWHATQLASGNRDVLVPAKVPRQLQSALLSVRVCRSASRSGSLPLRRCRLRRSTPHRCWCCRSRSRYRPLPR